MRPMERFDRALEKSYSGSMAYSGSSVGPSSITIHQFIRASAHPLQGTPAPPQSSCWKVLSGWSSQIQPLCTRGNSDRRPLISGLSGMSGMTTQHARTQLSTCRCPKTGGWAPNASQSRRRARVQRRVQGDGPRGLPAAWGFGSGGGVVARPEREPGTQVARWSGLDASYLGRSRSASATTAKNSAGSLA